MGLGLLIGIAGVMLAVSPAGRLLEENLGLVWLFQLRGPLPAPQDVAIISIDHASSKHLQLPNKPRLWPRRLHADLVQILKQQGASVVFFDIIFEEPRDAEHNRRFAEAMRDANNVILFEYLRREILPLSNTQNEIHVERLISPVAELRDSAFGLAPFPLPKVPAKVNHFLLFKPELDNAPTMPVVMLHGHALAVHDDLYRLLQQQVPDLLAELPAQAGQIRQQGNIQRVVKRLRQVFEQRPHVADTVLTALTDATRRAHITNRRDDTLAAQQAELLQALIETYRSPPGLYLNLYGPARTIQTTPYYQALAEPQHLDVKGKAVFVGFSEEFQPEQQDGFYTVYTNDRSGLDISGVEIGATAFANLLHRQSIQALNPWLDLGLFMSWGILLGMTLRRLGGVWIVPAGLSLGAVYLLAVYLLFSRNHLWLPLIIPLLWQLPLAVVASLVLGYRQVQRERRNIRQAFGYHLPIEVVDQLARGIAPNLTADRHVHGIVLATDAEQYTALSEKLAPGELRHLMNRYYETLFVPIRTANGIVSDVVGDAVLALWAGAQTTAALRENACRTALAIRSAVDQFNLSIAPLALPTRIGLHCGEIVMGHVGAVDHYEYRAVGDIVNTASRIEGLNRQLGTRILVSSAILEGLTHFINRDVGTFLLVGKQTPLTLHELLGDRLEQTNSSARTQILHFNEALTAFRTQRWADAIYGFTHLLQLHPDDGPAHYYLTLSEHYLQQPPEHWDGVIRLSQK